MTATAHAAVVQAPAQLVIGSRYAFREQITRMLEAGHRHFVIDFSLTSYVDSSGFGILVAVSKRIKEQGGSLVLRGVHPSTMDVMRVTGLALLFTFEQEAAA